MLSIEYWRIIKVENKPEQQPQFKAMSISNKPLRKDIVGRAGEFVDDFLLAMDSESIYKKMAVNPDKTFLITGNAGTGKTLGIKTLINEANKEIYKGWLSGKTGLTPNLLGMAYDIGKYGTAYINMGSKIAQSFFDICYKTATKQKVIVVFDEAEVLFGNRASEGNHKEDNKLLDTIMKNLQILHDTPNMYAVMMSNFPEAFDEASIRAGRIDKRYQFELPNELERKVAYDHTINSLNSSAGYQVIRCYDSLDLAKITHGYSYADVSESVYSAVKKRATEIARVRTNKNIPSGYVSQKRLEDAINEHTTSFNKSTKSSRIGFI